MSNLKFKFRNLLYAIFITVCFINIQFLSTDKDNGSAIKLSTIFNTSIASAEDVNILFSENTCEIQYDQYGQPCAKHYCWYAWDVCTFWTDCYYGFC